ncbi:MAG: autotransporter-associated beta strand repeat-containing protein, partial [Thermoguttaceae bacterium]
DGARSTWTNTGTLNIDNGTLTISNGGAVHSAKACIGDYTRTKSTVTVDGAGSMWDNPGMIRITGTLNVTNGGAVTGGTIASNSIFLPFTDTVNIVNGGSVSTDMIAVRIANLNGGILKAYSASNANWVSFGKVYVQEGGATFDTAGYNMGISLPLLHGGSAGADGGITKLGAGVLTFFGANTYNGLTTVNAGTLDLYGTSSSTAVWNSVLFGTGAEINGGQLIFDYSGGAADPATMIAGLLGNKIHTTVAGARVSFYDNTVAKQVVVGLSPVPEPSTLVLLGAGAVSLLGYTWRCRRRPHLSRRAEPL